MRDERTVGWKEWRTDGQPRSNMLPQLLRSWEHKKQMKLGQGILTSLPTCSKIKQQQQKL